MSSPEIIHESKEPMAQHVDQPTHVVDVGDGITAKKEGAKVAVVHNVRYPVHPVSRARTELKTNIGRNVCGYPGIPD